MQEDQEGKGDPLHPDAKLGLVLSQPKPLLPSVCWACKLRCQLDCELLSQSPVTLADACRAPIGIHRHLAFHRDTNLRTAVREVLEMHSKSETSWFSARP